MTHTALTELRHLEDEDPQLHIIWNEQLQEIHVQVMGEVQLEVLKRIIKKRDSVLILNLVTVVLRIVKL